jgi:hypothetical protein
MEREHAAENVAARIQAIVLEALEGPGAPGAPGATP